MLTTSPEALESDDFDLIVVGGGVYGAAIALEGCVRGLRPLLLEKADFGGATSANSLRILHGGLRYLQSFDLLRFRDSVIQRRWWLRTFPELVRPLPCLMPLHGEGLRRPPILRAALRVNDLLSLDRNRGVRNDRVLPRSRIMSPSETRDAFPAVRNEGLEGAALWYDASMERPHRLIMEMLRWVVREGGAALNYVEATGVLRESGRVMGVRALRRTDGAELEFRTPLVVNAAGPWSRLVARAGDTDVPELFRPSLAFNLLLSRPLPSETPVAVYPPGSRRTALFLRPYGRLTFAGTVHASWEASEDPPERTPAHLVSRFIRDLRKAVPGFPVTEDDVVRDLPGLMPAEESGMDVPARRPVIHDHGRRGGPQGLVSVSGVKYTTAPGVARQVLDRALGRIPGATRHRFWEGRPAVGVVPSVEEFRSLRDSSPAQAREVLRTFVEDEAVVSAEDLVLRRLDWGLEVEDVSCVIQEIETLFGESFLPTGRPDNGVDIAPTGSQ